MDIVLSKPFARNTQVDGYDVRQMKKALNRLGYYHPFEKTGITAIPDEAVFQALMRFQADHNLRPNGTVRPGDHTIAALNLAMAEAPDGQYVWRSVGDGRVRGAHAALDGQQRQWSDSPDPGEDFNCRCWADPVSAAGGPQGPPDCREEKQAADLAGKKVREIKDLIIGLAEDAKDIKREKDEVFRRLTKLFGGILAVQIINWPSKWLDNLHEAIRFNFGIQIESQLQNEIEFLGERLKRIREKIQEKLDQKAILDVRHSDALRAWEDADARFKECMRKNRVYRDSA